MTYYGAMHLWSFRGPHGCSRVSHFSVCEAKAEREKKFVPFVIVSGSFDKLKPSHRTPGEELVVGVWRMKSQSHQA